jgi:hypothetical protein
MVNDYVNRPDRELFPVNGMPGLLDRNARVLLLDSGATVVVCHRDQLSFHELRRSEDTIEAKQNRCHRIEGQIISVTSYDSQSVIIASSRKDRTYLQVADAESLRDLTSFLGRAIEVEAVGQTIFVSLKSTAEQPPSLIAVHARTGAIIKTQNLPSSDVTLSASPAVNSVMIADRRTQTIRNFSDKMQYDPSPQQRSSPQAFPQSVSLPDNKSHCCSNPETQDSVKQYVPRLIPRPKLTSNDGRRLGTSWILEDCDEWVAKGSIVTRNPLCNHEGPCNQRLDFEISKMYRTGKHLLTASAHGRELVLMDAHSLRVLYSHSFGRDGAALATSHDAKMILAYKWASRSWMALDIDAVVEHLSPLDTPSSTPAESITFYGNNLEGLPALPALRTGLYRVIALPVVEPGQDFGDPDVSNFGAFMHPNSFDLIHRYYDEVSSGQVTPALLDVQIELFGSDIGPPGGPLLMPKAFRDYFFPPFRHGGLTTNVTADTLPYNVSLDGTEQLTLHVVPRTRSEENLTVPFYAIGFRKVYDLFPVTLVFDGSGAAQMQVVDSAGRTWNLSLNFPLHTINIEAADVDAGLTQLRTYLISVLHSAEAAANVFPGSHLFDIEVRRVKTTGADFGNLDINFRYTAFGGGAVKATVNLVSQSNLTLLGFDNSSLGQFSFGADQGRLQSYLDRIIREAETDAGYDFTNSLIGGVSVSFVGSMLTIEIRLSENDGGESENPPRKASISALGLVWKLGSLGFNAAQTVEGQSNANDQNTLRGIEFLNDVFTAAVDRLGLAGGPVAFLSQFNAVLIAIVGAPPTGEWNAEQPDVAGLRMFQWPTTAKYKHDDSIQLSTNYIATILDATPDNATMAHELGHALGLPDLYRKSGFRDDLLYMDNWDIMNNHGQFPHISSYHKHVLGWIDIGQVEAVPLPNPSGPISSECLLVPVEYWDAGMEAAVQSTFGSALPVRRAMHIDLGGDGMQLDVVEARQKGIEFSQSLPATGAVLVYNAIDINDDTRYAEDKLYRRKIHRLNTGSDLVNAGDVFDLAAAPELSAVGVKISIIDKRPVLRPYGTVNVFHARVDREQADYVDLHFTEASPAWKCVDIYVDWAGDNPSTNPEDHHQYPDGQPLSQGEKVRYPSSGEELHWVVARVHNQGTAPAKNVKVNARRYNPGAGDTGDKPIFRTNTIDEVPAGGFVTVPLRWDVTREDNVHQCLRFDIADWDLPQDHADAIALASDDVWLSNNWGQKNVTEFVAKKGSPYEPIIFEYTVTNDGIDCEKAYLEPEGLPIGMKLTVSPRLRVIAPNETAIFLCTLELDDNVIASGSENDREFLLVTWRVADDSSERWGACKYKIRPRKKTEVTIDGHWNVLFPGIQVSGSVTPDSGSGSILLRTYFEGHEPTWRRVDLWPGGTYILQFSPEANVPLEVMAYYEGSAEIADAYSPVLHLTPS